MPQNIMVGRRLQAQTTAFSYADNGFHQFFILCEHVLRIRFQLLSKYHLPTAARLVGLPQQHLWGEVEGGGAGAAVGPGVSARTQGWGVGGALGGHGGGGGGGVGG